MAQFKLRCMDIITVCRARSSRVRSMYIVGRSLWLNEASRAHFSFFTFRYWAFEIGNQNTTTTTKTIAILLLWFVVGSGLVRFVRYCCCSGCSCFYCSGGFVSSVHWPRLWFVAAGQKFAINFKFLHSLLEIIGLPFPILRRHSRTSR